ELIDTHDGAYLSFTDQSTSRARRVRGHLLLGLIPLREQAAVTRRQRRLPPSQLPALAALVETHPQRGRVRQQRRLIAAGLRRVTIGAEQEQIRVPKMPEDVAVR